MTPIAAALVWIASSWLAGETVISPATTSDGVLTHDVVSPFQDGATQIRVLLPPGLAPGEKRPVVYLLPVEARREVRYGDGLAEAKKQALHEKHRAVFVAPTFSQLPWYADHPEAAGRSQESYFLKVVVPFIEQTYPARTEPSGRLLAGFSKSGWGAWSLLLRHPHLFGRAAAFDAPLMMDRPGKYGSGPIFATDENFRGYQVTTLLRARGAALGSAQRLISLGYGNFRADHEQAHALLNELGVPHIHRDGPKRAHDWHSGWLPEAVELLLALDAQ